MTVFAAFAADIRHVLAIFADRFAAFLADRRHVLAILADRLAALAARFTRFFGAEFMRMATFMRRTSTLAGYFALPRLVHAGEAPAATIITRIFICHCLDS
jgi:hypothetical protein